MRYLLIALIFGFVLGQSGCFARGGVSGEERVNIDVPIKQLHQAITTVMRVEKIVIQEDTVDNASLLVKGHFADGEKVTIHAKSLTTQASMMTIQIGLFGNKLRSSALLEKILAKTPQQAASP